MLISLSVSSQIDTTTRIIHNKDSVTISKEVAKKVVKDLILLDATIQENSLLKDNIVLYKRQISNKDSIIGAKDLQINAYQSIVSDYKKNQQLYDQRIHYLEKENKWQKFVKTSFGVLLVGAVFAFAIK